jgi:ribonuclease P/MRP protein subunit POP1
VLNEQIQQVENNTVKHEKLNNVKGSYDATGIGRLSPRPHGNLKYHKRQSKFVWLPTHIWHAKRFHLIKQFGYQIPSSPTQKCFRLMNRQSKQGSILFDTSYYDSLVVSIPDNNQFTKFLLEVTKYRNKVPQSIVEGRKSYNGWLRFHDRNVGLALVYANINTKNILIRVHPSIYEEVFDHTKEKISNINSSVLYDCRYSLGSLDITGPIAIKTISLVLHLSNVSDEIKNTFFEVTKINDSGIVPVGTTFAFNIRDPRLWKNPSEVPANPKDISNNTINQLIIDLSTKMLVQQTSLENLLSPEGRYNSYNNQLSIKNISREFGKVGATSKSLGKEIIDKTEFPVLITKTDGNTWSIITPWFWIQPIWVMATKVSKIKVGGVRQRAQLNFENDTPTYPQDYPWLRDGWQYNETMGKLHQDKYNKVPKHHKQDHKQDYQDIKYLTPFNCGWTTLRNTNYIRKLYNLTTEQLQSGANQFAQFDENTLNRIVNNYHDLRQVVKSLDRPMKSIPIEPYDKFNEFHEKFINDDYTISTLEQAETTALPVIQISLKIVNDGTIKDNARIFPYNLVKEKHDNVDLCEVIGFVTSGSLNLNSGAYQGIGLIIAQKWTQPLFYIRNVGETNFYLVEGKIIQ